MRYILVLLGLISAFPWFFPLQEELAPYIAAVSPAADTQAMFLGGSIVYLQFAVSAVFVILFTVVFRLQRRLRYNWASDLLTLTLFAYAAIIALQHLSSLNLLGEALLAHGSKLRYAVLPMKLLYMVSIAGVLSSLRDNAGPREAHP